MCLQHLDKWPKMMPLCVHAEGQTLAAVLMLAQLCQRPLHICHVATKAEVAMVVCISYFVTSPLSLQSLQECTTFKIPEADQFLQVTDTSCSSVSRETHTYCKIHSQLIAEFGLRSSYDAIIV